MMVICWLAPFAALAEDRLVRLHAPAALVDTGVMDYVLPRFSLKTGVKVELVNAADAANMTLGTEGRPVFQGAGATWRMALRTPEHEGAKRFADWLGSDIGLRTVTSYAPDGDALFAPPVEEEVEVAAVSIDGDAVLGEELSRVNCGRCHAIDLAGRKNDIGSTPSFFVLRSFSDWQDRFRAFYVLNPHGAFTQIAEVTPPFPEGRPSPIVPIEITLDELEAILAYVAAMEAADLGAPLQHQ